MAKRVRRYISELLQAYQEITGKTYTEIALDFDISLSNLYLYRTEQGNPTADTIDKIVDVVKQTLEKTPPELASDIMERGIVLAGGGALIQNLDKLLSERTEMPVYIAENPLECVARGAEKTLEDLEKLRTVLMNSRRRR